MGDSFWSASVKQPDALATVLMLLNRDCGISTDDLPKLWPLWPTIKSEMDANTLSSELKSKTCTKDVNACLRQKNRNRAFGDGARRLPVSAATPVMNQTSLARFFTA